MHKIFTIPELLDEIFSYSSRHTNFVAIRVCRLWFTHSVPLLWDTARINDALEVLLHSSDYPYPIKRKLLPQFWDRFFLYSKHIRFLECVDVDHYALRRAISSRPSSDFFSSKLTVLRWEDHCLGRLPDLLVSSLQILRIQLGEESKLGAINYLFEVIPILSPSLHVLELFFKFESDMPAQAVPRSLVVLPLLLPKLISFALPAFCAQAPEMLETLSQLRRLEDLTLLHSDGNLEALCVEELLKRRSMDDEKAVTECPPFHSLKKLEICDFRQNKNTFPLVMTLGQHIRLPNLVDLTYCPHDKNYFNDWDPDQIVALLESIHIVCPSLQKMLISAPRDEYAVSNELQLPWAGIQSLLKCPALVELRSQHPVVDLKLEHLATLATNRSSWKVLRLPSSEPLSFQALDILAEHCPNLVELALTFANDFDLGLPDTLTPAFTFTSLAVLDIRYSVMYIFEGDVALFLSRIRAYAKPLEIKAGGWLDGSWEGMQKTMNVFKNMELEIQQLKNQVALLEARMNIDF